jgi:hypothetical protein
LVARYVGSLEASKLHDDEAHFHEVPHDYKPLKLQAETVKEYFRDPNFFKADRKAAKKAHGLRHKKNTKTPDE